MVEGLTRAHLVRGRGCTVLRIELQLAEKAHWAEIFDPRNFAVYVRNDDPPQIGERVRLDLTVGVGGPRVILRGQVRSRQASSSELPGGFHLALGRYEREKVTYLSGFVRGGLLDLRQTRRLPVRLPVTYSGSTGTRTGYTRDLNEKGLFVVDEDPFPENSEVRLELAIPGRGEPIALVGSVSHTVLVEDEDVPGMGIRLQLNDAARKELEAVVDDLEQRFAAGELPEETLL